MTTKKVQLARNLLIALALFCLSAVASQNRKFIAQAKKVHTEVRAGISESLWKKRIPANNPMSSRKIELGRELYFDKRLSIDGTVSCATCHDPALAFTDSKTVAIGAGAKLGTRNTPTILNAVFSELLFWDGRARSLEDQVRHPLLSSFEMGMESKGQLTNRLSSLPEYRRQFQEVFKSEGLTIDTIAKAIAAYERTLLSGNSPFDRFITGNSTAITDAQKRGWELFKGKAKCIECHTYSQRSPFFTDFKFHNTGVAAAGDTLSAKFLAVFTTSLVAVDHRDARPFLQEPLHGRCADPARSACDHHSLVG
jgi:cytochrome c peroxidase